MDPLQRRFSERYVYRMNCAIGVHEDPPGSNTGKEVDIYTGHYGLHAVPWCACIAGYELDGSAKDCGIASGWMHIDARCPYIVADARKQGRIIQPERVYPGCLAVFSEGGHYRHVEVCIGPVTGVFVPTIGGNTSNAAGLNPDGGCVCVKHRSIAGVTFVDACRLS